MEAAMNLFSSSPTPFPSPRTPPHSHLRNSLSASSSVSILHEQAAVSAVTSVPSAAVSRQLPASVLLREQLDEESQRALDRRDIVKTRSLDGEEITPCSGPSGQSLRDYENQLLDWQNLSYLLPSLSYKGKPSLSIQHDAANLDRLMDFEPSQAISLAQEALLASKEAKYLAEDFDEFLSSRSKDTSLSEKKTVRSTRLKERRSRKRKVTKPTLTQDSKHSQRSDLKINEGYGSNEVTKPRLTPDSRSSQRADLRRKLNEGYDPNDPLRLFLWGPETRQLLTVEEESELIDQIQDMKKLMEVKTKLQSQFNREPSLIEWAEAAGLSYRALQSEIHTSNRSREKLITSNLRMVVHVAKQYQGKGLSLQDLLQVGSTGLMKSVEKFKPQAGCRFPSYAYWWIRQSVRKALFQHSRTIRLPENVYSLLGKVMEAKKSYAREGHSQPTKEELAQRAGITVDKLQSLLYFTRTTLSMQQPIWADQDLTFQEITADTGIENPDVSVTKQLMRQHVRNLLVCLTSKERRIIRLRFGIGCEKQNSLSEIGDTFGLSKERVRQLESRALYKLKQSLGSQGLSTYVGLLV